MKERKYTPSWSIESHMIISGWAYIRSNILFLIFFNTMARQSSRSVYEYLINSERTLLVVSFVAEEDFKEIIFYFDTRFTCNFFMIKKLYLKYIFIYTCVAVNDTVTYMH